LIGLIRSGASDDAFTGGRDGAIARVELITSAQRQWRWCEEQTRAIVAESFAPGAVVTEVVGRTDIGPGQIYPGGNRYWRRPDPIVLPIRHSGGRGDGRNHPIFSSFRLGVL
jgi:hypothetical protein